MIRRPPRSTLSSSSAASDVYKRQFLHLASGSRGICWRGECPTTGGCCRHLGSERQPNCCCCCCCCHLIAGRHRPVPVVSGLQRAAKCRPVGFTRREIESSLIRISWRAAVGLVHYTEQQCYLYETESAVGRSVAERRECSRTLPVSALSVGQLLSGDAFELYCSEVSQSVIDSDT